MIYYNKGAEKMSNEEKKEAVSFPWLLVIQIVLAIISYLIRRTPALAASDRSYLFDLKHKLEAGFPEARSGGWGPNDRNEF